MGEKGRKVILNWCGDSARLNLLPTEWRGEEEKRVEEEGEEEEGENKKDKSGGGPPGKVQHALFKASIRRRNSCASSSSCFVPRKIENIKNGDYFFIMLKKAFVFIASMMYMG